MPVSSLIPNLAKPRLINGSFLFIRTPSILSLLSEKRFRSFLFGLFLYFLSIFIENYTKLPKVIILAGAISSGKTTLGKILEKFLTQLGYKVYHMREVSLNLQEKLEIFYETKNALFFQK